VFEERREGNEKPVGEEGRPREGKEKPVLDWLVSMLVMVSVV
jgi:hypothetical protein